MPAWPPTRPSASGAAAHRGGAGRRLEDHARVIGMLVDYAHRLGLRAWVSRREHDRPYAGATLLDRLQDDERRAYLPLVIRAPAERWARSTPCGTAAAGWPSCSRWSGPP